MSPHCTELTPAALAQRRSLARHSATGLALATLVGCATPLPPAAPALPTPAAFSAQADAPAAAARSDGAWWKVFADPQLDTLIERAAAANTSLQQAAARVAQSRAALHAAGAARTPLASLSAGASRQGGPLVNAAGTDGSLINVGAHLAYEVDLIGRLSKDEQAATLDVQSREALLQSARLLMEADIAQTYFSLRALDQERAVLQENAQAQRETLGLVERRRRAGLTTEQELVRARAEAAAVDAQALALSRRRATLEHALAFLSGVHFADATRLMALDMNAAPLTLPVIPPGIPGSVLARRPDVAAAERTMQATRLRLGVAHAAWLPPVSLTASGGFASFELADLLKSAARGWGLGLLLSLPLFDGGRHDARVESAAADVALADAVYREQLLVALREVEDQLSALRGLADEAAVLRGAQDDAARAADLARSRYASGLASLLEVLDAQRSARRDRLALLQVEASRQLATVGLVRALGGGWSAAVESPPTADAGEPDGTARTSLHTAAR